jgi:magnesium transporter
MLTIRRSTKNRVEEISKDLAADLLRQNQMNLWFHLDNPTDDELDFLKRELKIHTLTLEDIVKQNQRPKIEPFPDYVYLALHPLIRKPGWDVEPSELDLLISRRWLVSAHPGPLPGIIEGSKLNDRLAPALERGTDFLLYTIVDLVVDSYFPILDEIEDHVDSLQDELLEGTTPEDMSRLLRLKRSLIYMRRAVSPQREIFNQLTRHDFPFGHPDNLVYFRDVYDHLIRITDEIDSLRDLLSGALEIHLASVSNQLNVTMKRLSAWGTILVAIAAIAGIYGMNFKFIPELEWHYGYFFALGLMTLISAALYLYFKKKDYV